MIAKSTYETPERWPEKSAGVLRPCAGIALIFLDLLVLLHQGKRTWKTRILGFADNSKGVAGVKAQGILEHFYGEHYCDCVNTTVDNNKSASTPFTSSEFAEAMGLKVSTEPNPASTWVAFNYELPLGTEKAQLIIRNTDGKVVGEFQLSGNISQKVWNTSNLKAGTYIFELISGDIKQTGKIVIVK